MSQKGKCSCIIPFYNENIRVISVIKAILRVNNIEKVICVDDGSETDEISNEIKNKFSEVKVVRLEKNRGKSGAIEEGLKYVSTPYVILIDADLGNIKPSEIEEAINSIVSNSSVDMLILRRVSDPWFSKLIRGEILTSGERILLADDLRSVFKEHSPKGYQLEYAINFYMMKHNKNAYWFPYSGQNLLKIEKVGFIKGLENEISMYVDMLRYAGLILPLKSLFSFCRENIRKEKFSDLQENTD